jgi:hypothetical protein
MIWDELVSGFVSSLTLHNIGHHILKFDPFEKTRILGYKKFVHHKIAFEKMIECHLKSLMDPTKNE